MPIKQKNVCLKFHTMDPFLCSLLVNINNQLKKMLKTTQNKNKKIHDQFNAQKQC